MKAVILCGGQGFRLREHTERIPKPLVAIGGRPMLWHIMKIYGHHWTNEFILCLGYKGEEIKRYFLEYETLHADFTLTLGTGRQVEWHGTHAEADWKISFVDTGDKAMTGCRVARIKKFIGSDDEFMLTYGDGVADLDISALLAFHRKHGKIGTVTGVHPTSRFGELVLDGDQVGQFSEKPLVSQGWINGGFFVFNRKFFDYLDADDESCTLERDPLERLAADGELMMFAHDGFWQPMDTYREWKKLDDAFTSGNAPWKVWE